jgi:hypothetical protein
MKKIVILNYLKQTSTTKFFFQRFSLFTYANHPSPKHGGFNSGMMLMNLEGLRKNGWSKKVLVINEELAPANVYGDQVGT